MIKECFVSELKAKLDTKENFVLVDCREAPEWNEAHIEGAKLLPLSILDQKYTEVLPDKNAQIVVQCRSGARSMRACMFLMSQGYTNLANLETGIMGWLQAGLPVVTGE